MRNMGRPAEKLNPNPKADRKTFDAVVKQLCESPASAPRESQDGETKLGKILGK
jgi:hypothetical protein